MAESEGEHRQTIDSPARQTILTTDRLELRPTGPEMFEGIWSAVKASLNELQLWMAWAVDAKENGTFDFLQKSAAEWRTGNDRHFTLFFRGEASGQCGLTRGDPLLMSAEIGYWLRSDLCGRGLISEAANEVVTFGFEQEGLHRIELRAGVNNHGSNRVAEKLGFTRRGTLRDASRAAHGFYDCYVYDLLVTDPRP
ncbi:MAG: GNAT family N-acetyltransferase [Actinomycetota bacterium]|nr:GNAT family N-acetyltransferase [Actinomycetota bacterium]